MKDTEPQLDGEIQNLLNDVRQGTADYPLYMKERRAARLRQAALGLAAVPQAGGFLKGRLVKLLHLPAKTVEGLLITVLVIEVATSFYIFRDQIVEMIFNPTPTATAQVAETTPKGMTTPMVSVSGTPTSEGTFTATVTALVTKLPSQTVTPQPYNSTQQGTTPGWHYGQTKTVKP